LALRRKVGGLSDFKHYVLGRAYGLDEVAEDHEKAVVAGFEEFCETELPDLLRINPDIGDIVPKLAKAWLWHEEEALRAQLTKQSDEYKNEKKELEAEHSRKSDLWAAEKSKLESQVSQATNTAKSEREAYQSKSRESDGWKLKAEAFESRLVQAQTTAALLPSQGGGRLIQSSYGNFEAVVLERGGPSGKQLVHYWRDNSNGYRWYRGPIISTNATADAALIQGNLPTGSRHGNLELLVHEGRNLVHYWREENSKQWFRGPTVSSQATGVASFIQSTLGQPGRGNFEAVILEGNSLVHYWRDNSNNSFQWYRGPVITSYC